MTGETRRRLVWSAALALVLSASVVMLEGSFFAFEQITVDATAGGKTFTAANLTLQGNKVSRIWCRLEAAQIRVLKVGPGVAAVTASVGTLMEVGDQFTLTDQEEMLNFRAIRTGVTSGVLNCEYKAVP